MTNALQAVLDKAARRAGSAPVAEPEAAAKPRATARRSAPTAQPITTPAPATAPAAEGPRKFERPVRVGKRFVGAHLAPEVARQLRMIAAEDDTTIQELLEEAIDLLFVKKGRAVSSALEAKRA